MEKWWYIGTWPYHLSRRQRSIDVKSLMLSLCRGQGEGVSSLSLIPQVQRITALSLWRSRRNSGSFSPIVSLPWSIAERTQASHTSPRILGERCLVVRTSKSFLNFPQATQHLAAMTLSQPLPEHIISPIGSRKWLPLETCCRRHPLESQFGHRWAETHAYTWGRYRLGLRPLT